MGFIGGFRFFFPTGIKNPECVQGSQFGNLSRQIGTKQIYKVVSSKGSEPSAWRYCSFWSLATASGNQIMLVPLTSNVWSCPRFANDFRNQQIRMHPRRERYRRWRSSMILGRWCSLRPVVCSRSSTRRNLIIFLDTKKSPHSPNTVNDRRCDKSSILCITSLSLSLFQLLLIVRWRIAPCAPPRLHPSSSVNTRFSSLAFDTQI